MIEILALYYLAQLYADRPLGMKLMFACLLPPTERPRLEFLVSNLRALRN